MLCDGALRGNLAIRFDVPQLAANRDGRFVEFASQTKVAGTFAVWWINKADRKVGTIQRRLVRAANLKQATIRDVCTIVALADVTSDDHATPFNLEDVNDVPQELCHLTESHNMLINDSVSFIAQTMNTLIH
jgi:hypothetical protein